MNIKFQRVLSIALSIMMMLTIIPISVLATFDDPLTGETGSGWAEVGPAPDESGGIPLPDDTSSIESSKPPADSSEEQSPPPEKEEPIKDSSALQEHIPVSQDSWLQLYQKEALSWSISNQKGRAAGASNVPSTTGLEWLGNPITFANGAYIGSPLPKIYFNGEIAFCGEWNGQSPSGNYHEITSGNDDVIKQYLANFDKSSKGKAEYIATQILIWCRVMGTSVSSWGGSGATSAADKIQNGNADYSDLRYQYKEFGGGTQNIITYNTEGEEKPEEPDKPPVDYPEDKYRIEVKTDVVTETEVRNSKTYEYSDAIGQITVRKHDQDGMSLDGALFNIDVAFSDGSHTTVNSWEVDNGARLFTWTHPRDNHDPATVTVTEVQPPKYYEGDSAPKTAVVHPTYTRVTHVETWTVTITTENTSSTVIEIESGDVVAESTSSSSAEVESDPQVEEFTDFIAGDRETTVTFVNRRIASGLEIIKKDKLSGTLLPGATFRISWNNGAEYQDVTTDRNGSAMLTDLKDGWYSIVETNAPDGYLLDSTPQQILLESGKISVVEFFDEAKPALTILKLDSVTKSPLQFAKFRIEQKIESGNKLIGEYVSDADGIVQLDNIIPGRYLITEIAAPNGYNIDTASHEVTIEFGQAYKIELTNTPKSPIYIQKVDEKGAPLAGAKFKVTTMNGAMVGTITSGRTGFAIIPYAEPGWYVVEEVQAPGGYVLSSAPVNVEVKSGKPAQVEFVNYQKPMLQICKLDADTGKALMGAKFKVTEASGALVGEYTTDKDGLISIEGLLPGAYIISEIRSPDGYILDMTPKTITLESGKTLQVEFTNTAKPGLQLLKLDKLTGKPIKGVMFNVVQLLSGAKKDLGTFTTGKNGTFFIPDLTPGDYIITEAKAAECYIPDSTPKNIHVEGGKLNTVEFYNIPYGNLRLVKIDAETRAPLEGAIFKLFDEKRLEIGTYTTTALGEIIVQKLPSGNYFLQEVKAPAGYLLDNTVRAIELVSGKATTIEVKNQPLGSLRIVKVDAEAGKPLYGATFLLYDAKNNLLGEYTTDQNGSITFNHSLKDGKYLVKEIKAPEGYVLDQTIRTVTVKEGTTTEIKVENTPIRGKIQIIKKSADYNDMTKLKAGALLKDAVFEIFDKANVVVDRITTDSRGVATSKDLPVGVYGIREITAPKHYILDDNPFYAEIKIAGDLVKFEVLNDSEELGVDVQKFGNYEAMPGDIIRYDFEKIGNTSTVPLDDFYWRDVLPTDAVRLNKIVTGTWNERLTYEVEYKTNQRGWRTLEDDLSTKTNNTLDCSRTALHLKSGEYLTEFRFQFGTVQAGFAQEDAPYILCSVNGDLPNEFRFTNKTDVGGKRLKEWITAKDAWVTIIYAKPRGKLPQTGW